MSFKVKNEQLNEDEVVNLQNPNDSIVEEEKINKKADFFNILLLIVLYSMQGEV
jgi:hypothetical protein